VRNRRHKYRIDIPRPLDEDWLTIGDTLIWLPKYLFSENKSSFTGKPDITTDGAGWAIARSALNFILQVYYPEKTQYQIEWVTKIGEGLSREVYRADVTFKNNEEDHELFAVSLILHDADINAGSRLIKEQHILNSIHGKAGYFSVPKPIGLLWKDGMLFSFTSFIRGVPVSLKTINSIYEKPWEIVAKIAAEVHELTVQGFAQNIKQHKTRREHVISQIKDYEKINVPEIHDALTWILGYPSIEQKPVLLHGDLLGQNILRTFDERLFVIDWEYSVVGDPAYDLAIITRGVKNPFQAQNGLEHLIDSYLSAGGQQITKYDVYVHEMLFVIGWYQQSLDRSKGGHSPEYYLDFLKRLLKRAET
jgi:aminoglycoside phosphotransferase (APT) family kinase protein